MEEAQEETLATTFGERLVLLRKKKGLTVAQVASDVGISEDTWNALEANRIGLSVVFLWPLARVLGVRPAALLK